MYLDIYVYIHIDTSKDPNGQIDAKDGFRATVAYSQEALVIFRVTVGVWNKLLLSQKFKIGEFRHYDFHNLRGSAL